jgi:ribosomal protein L37AE/L43A
MHDEGDQRKIIFCGTETANLTLETCDECGATLAPQAYLSYLRNMTEKEPSGVAGKKLCPDCARKHWAKGQMGDTLWFPPAG